MTVRQILSLTLLLWVASLRAAPIRDNGVDPNNLGKGDWISFFQYATNNFHDPNPPPGVIGVKSVVDIPSVLAYEKSLGMDYVIVKAGTGSTNYMLGSERQFTTNLVEQAHAVGLKIFGYTRSYGADVDGEIEIATYVFNCGADGFVIDAEAEWEKSRPWIGRNGPALARKLCEGIRARFPNKFLAHSPMPVISYHSSFPYKEFGIYCDVVMPQLYWASFRKTPEETVAWMDQEWKRWYASLTGSDREAIKPIVPVGPGCCGISGGEIADFMNCLKSDLGCVSPTGYRGVNFFRAGRYAQDILQVFREINFSEPASTWKNFSNVRATDVTENSATITWSARSISRGTVEFGTTTNYGSSVSDPTPGFGHSIALTNLSANMVYHFRIRSTNMSELVDLSADFLFITTPKKILPDMIVDNPQASMKGNWYVSSGSSDQHGKDYAFGKKGNGSGYVEFATNVTMTGSYQVFEMHPEGVNRTTKAPHVISFGDRVQTHYVNQKVLGGKWNLLGTFQLTAGEHLAVRITDAIPEEKAIVMADAVKVSFYVPPTSEDSGADER